MNKKSWLGFAAVAALGLVNAAEIERTIVRQQWPWSTEIKVEYLVSGVTSPITMGVELYSGETALVVPSGAVTGDVCVASSGIGEIYIDPAKVLGAGTHNLADFKVRLTANPMASDPDEALYKIFDLASGSCEDVTRRDLLNGKWGTIETSFAAINPNFTTTLDEVLIWTGVTNNPIYKTDKLVMRKIHAKNQVWQSGDGEGASTHHCSLAPQHWIKLTYDYYIAVFETTQGQYKKVVGSFSGTDCTYTDDADADLRPVNHTKRYNVYAHPTAGGSYNGYVTGVPVVFPTNSYVRDVGGNSFCKSMWLKTNYEFNLPTGAEWEYACRAGQDGILYSGESWNETNARKLAWFYKSSEVTRPQVVGTKLPNAFGVYDMLGNVMEHANYNGEMNKGSVSGTGDSEADPAVDPTGNPNVTGDSHYWSLGGAACDSTGHFGYWLDCRVSSRSGSFEWWASRDFLGFRLVMPATTDGKWAAH